jgi:hypothetical protein
MSNHGILGTYPTTYVHPPTQIQENDIPVIVGNQIIFVRARRAYFNSVGTALGRRDISHKSTNLNLTGLDP